MNPTSFLYLIFFFTLGLNIFPINSKCYLDIKNDLNNYAPILYNETNFIYPKDNSSILNFEKNNSFVMSCPGKNNNLVIKNSTLDIGSLTVTCEDNDLYSYVDPVPSPVQNKSFDFKNVRCQKFAKPELRNCASFRKPDFSFCKGNSYRHFVSGYAVNEETFLEVLDICYNQKEIKPVITFEKIVPSISHKQFWKRNSCAFSNVETSQDINSAYLTKSQIAYFKQLFGDDQQYLSTKQNFERGHLVPKADFLYMNQQAATNYFANVVPMWKTINRGHWKEIESSVRNFAAVNGTEVYAWTGTIGILELRDKSKQLVKVFLHNVNSTSNKQVHLQVPKLLFKLVHEPSSGFSVVFVTINNPFWQFNTNDIICQDILSKISWVHLKDRANFTLGYTYACEYDEFKDKFQVLPNLTKQERFNIFRYTKRIFKKFSRFNL